MTVDDASDTPVHTYAAVNIFSLSLTNKFTCFRLALCLAFCLAICSEKFSPQNCRPNSQPKLSDAYLQVTSACRCSPVLTSAALIIQPSYTEIPIFICSLPDIAERRIGALAENIFRRCTSGVQKRRRWGRPENLVTFGDFGCSKTRPTNPNCKSN